MTEGHALPGQLDAEAMKHLLTFACAGDLEGIRALVASGFDLQSADQHGSPILELVIDALQDFPDAPKVAVVRELIRLGADPRQLNPEGSGPLFSAVLQMASELLRLLLEVGADPNLEKMDSACETLYDWAEFGYRYDVWNLQLPVEVDFDSFASEDEWLRYLDELAIQYGKLRPSHLQILRRYGALTMRELRGPAQVKE